MSPRLTASQMFVALGLIVVAVPAHSAGRMVPGVGRYIPGDMQFNYLTMSTCGKAQTLARQAAATAIAGGSINEYFRAVKVGPLSIVAAQVNLDKMAWLGKMAYRTAQTLGTADQIAASVADDCLADSAKYEPLARRNQPTKAQQINEALAWMKNIPREATPGSSIPDAVATPSPAKGLSIAQFIGSWSCVSTTTNRDIAFFPKRVFIEHTSAPIDRYVAGTYARTESGLVLHYIVEQLNPGYGPDNLRWKGLLKVDEPDAVSAQAYFYFNVKDQSEYRYSWAFVKAMNWNMKSTATGPQNNWRDCVTAPGILDALNRKFDTIPPELQAQEKF